MVTDVFHKSDEESISVQYRGGKMPIARNYQIHQPFLSAFHFRSHHLRNTIMIRTFPDCREKSPPRKQNRSAVRRTCGDKFSWRKRSAPVTGSGCIQTGL